MRSTTSRREIQKLVADARAQDPDATFAWHAHPPASAPDVQVLGLVRERGCRPACHVCLPPPPC